MECAMYVARIGRQVRVMAGMGESLWKKSVCRPRSHSMEQSPS
jgi:hypothetical protein